MMYVINRLRFFPFFLVPFSSAFFSFYVFECTRWRQFLVTASEAGVLPVAMPPPSLGGPVSVSPCPAMCRVGGSFSSPSSTRLCLRDREHIARQVGPAPPHSVLFQHWQQKYITGARGASAPQEPSGARQPASTGLSPNGLLWPSNWSLGSQGSVLLSRETGLSPWKLQLMMLCLLTRWGFYLFTRQIAIAVSTPDFWGSPANTGLWIFSCFIYSLVRSFCALSASYEVCLAFCRKYWGPDVLSLVPKRRVP